MDSAETGPTHSPRSRWPTLQRLTRRFAHADAVAADSQFAMPSVSEPPKTPAQQVSVLVVDDNPVNLLLVSEMLSWWGIKAMLADDGADAVALAYAQRLDLILMDLQMPVLDGLGATRQIRRFEQEHNLPRVPVVAYTTSAMSWKVLEDFGLDDVLEKPCGLPALQECLQQWCAPAKNLASFTPPALQHCRL